MANSLQIGAGARNRRIFVILFAGFVVTGVVTTILGPSLPVLIARWSMDDARAGLFFTTVFLGSMAGVGLSSALLSWKGFRPALVLGFGLMAAGIAAWNSGERTIALMASVAFGCGFGTAIPATNLWVAEAAGARRSAALNLLNLAWGAGALACPPLVFAAIRANSFGELLGWIAGACGALAFILAVTPMEPQATKEMDSETHAEPVRNGLLVAIALGMLFFLYVGTENGISGWAAAHMKRLGTAPETTWALAPMFFWAALLAGRGLAPIALLRWRERHIVIAGLLVTAAGTVVLIRARSNAAAIAGVLMAGAGLASLYPIFIAWLSNWYGMRARRIGGAMFALAALGGATMPPLVGIVSMCGGSLRVGLLVPLGGCIAMLGVLALLGRRRLA